MSIGTYRATALASQRKPHVDRVFPLLIPAPRVGQDIIVDFSPFGVIPDDVLVIIALPDISWGTIYRAPTMDRAPTFVIQNEDPMHMVGHDNERPQFGGGKMYWDDAPTFSGDAANWGQNHFTIHHLPKQAFALPGADGDEIRPSTGVIITLPAYRAALVLVRVEMGGQRDLLERIVPCKDHPDDSCSDASSDKIRIRCHCEPRRGVAISKDFIEIASLSLAMTILKKCPIFCP
jgi:hypothetical protein